VNEGRRRRGNRRLSGRFSESDPSDIWRTGKTFRIPAIRRQTFPPVRYLHIQSCTLAYRIARQSILLYWLSRSSKGRPSWPRAISTTKELQNAETGRPGNRSPLLRSGLPVRLPSARSTRL